VCSAPRAPAGVTTTARPSTVRFRTDADRAPFRLFVSFPPYTTPYRPRRHLVGRCARLAREDLHEHGARGWVVGGRGDRLDQRAIDCERISFWFLGAGGRFPKARRGRVSIVGFSVLLLLLPPLFSRALAFYSRAANKKEPIDPNPMTKTPEFGRYTPSTRIFISAQLWI